MPNIGDHYGSQHVKEFSNPIYREDVLITDVKNVDFSTYLMCFIRTIFILKKIENLFYQLIIFNKSERFAMAL